MEFKVSTEERRAFQRNKARFAAADAKRSREWYEQALDYSKTLDSRKFPLLTNEEILRWMHFNMFEGRGRARKISEDAWGVAIVGEILGKKVGTQWSAILGEAIARELYSLVMPGGNLIPQPEFSDKKHFTVHTLDWAIEVDGRLAKLVEVKCGSYNTSGTACQKTYAVPRLYEHVPEIAGSSVDICVVGGQERITRLDQHLLESVPEGIIRTASPDDRFTYIGATEILHKHIMAK